MSVELITTLWRLVPSHATLCLIPRPMACTRWRVSFRRRWRFRCVSLVRSNAPPYRVFFSQEHQTISSRESVLSFFAQEVSNRAYYIPSIYQTLVQPTLPNRTISSCPLAGYLEDGLNPSFPSLAMISEDKR